MCFPQLISDDRPKSNVLSDDSGEGRWEGYDHILCKHVTNVYVYTEYRKQFIVCMYTIW